MSLTIEKITVDQAIALIEANDYIAIDTETTGAEIRDGRGYAIGLSISSILGDFVAHGYFPVRHAIGTNLDHSDKEKLKRAIENYKGTVFFHNAKFDLVSLATMGINYRGKFLDTILMAHLINEEFPYSKDLTTLAKHYLGPEESKKDDQAFKEAVKIWGWDLPVELMEPYASWDAALTFRLGMVLLPLFEQNVNAAYWDHKQKFLRTVIDMENQGIGVDLDFCRRKIAIGEAIMADIVEIHGINPGSPKDLNDMLIGQLGLPVVKISAKTGNPSFDKKAMEVYEEMLERLDNPLAERILTYRGWQKAVSSYYRPYLELISPDGKLRPNYKLHGTITGRMSCERPNLQQIPKESTKEWNGDLKKCFVPTPGYKLYEADYSQLELRLATAYSKDKILMEIFAQGRDVFTEMSKDLGMSRQDTKTLVYSIQYGGGVNRVKEVFGVSADRAREIRQNFFDTYPGFRKVAEQARNACLVDGKVRIWSGRYRHFRFRADEAHKAFNSVMQGGAADLVENAIVRLHEEVMDENCRMLLTVHDSIVFEVREGMEGHYFPLIEKTMVDMPGDFGVRFAVEIKELA